MIVYSLPEDVTVCVHRYLRMYADLLHNASRASDGLKGRGTAWPPRWLAVAVWDGSGTLRGIRGAGDRRVLGWNLLKVGADLAHGAIGW